jgi:hypothetical protein
VCGLRFSTSDPGDPQAKPLVLLDATRFNASKARGYDKEEIVRASLECLRRTLPAPLAQTPVSLRCAERDKPWLSAIVAAFNAHPRGKPFFPASGQARNFPLVY